MNDDDLAQTEFLETLAQAQSFTDINIAAGIALSKPAKHRHRGGIAVAAIVVLLALLMAFHPGSHLDAWGHELYEAAA